MAQVTVTIAGKSYRMACGDGEETHLTGLAADLDAKIEELRGAFGEIGDMRLHVMAALTVADELAEAKRRIARMERDQEMLQDAAGSSNEQASVAEARIAASVIAAAERIERVARELNASVQAA